MKNHFIFGYAGNKREEVEKIYEETDLTDIKNIVEPFSGTCALSYYISTLHPKKFTYHINDNNKHLIELYKILKSKTKTNKLNKDYNKIAKTLNKEIYNNLDKSMIGYLIHSKIYSIRAGLFPLDYKYKEIDFNSYPIVKFLRTEKIIITNIDGSELLQRYMNDKSSFIFLDPPYLMACNDFYNCPTVNIYEYMCNNDIHNYKCKFISVLEDNWIIKLLFKGKNMVEYDKLYQGSKKKTKHLLIKNNKAIV
jgi:site-specific DNA-adenine methylase